ILTMYILKSGEKSTRQSSSLTNWVKRSFRWPTSSAAVRQTRTRRFIKKAGGTYGKCKRNTEQNKKCQGHDEDHQCHVYDLLFQNEESKKSSGGYGTIFL